MLLEESYKRNRWILFSIILLCIIAGLASRSDLPLPTFYKEHAGDLLWATMFYFIFALVFPKQKISFLAMLTLSFSYLIEFSQLIQIEWLNALRQTPLRYLLGQGFLTSDLLRYTIGVLLAIGIDILYKTFQSH